MPHWVRLSEWLGVISRYSVGVASTARSLRLDIWISKNQLSCVLIPYASATFATSEIVCAVMDRSLQYLALSQSFNGLVPLLALQPTQQRAIFEAFTMASSFTMCSQEGQDALGPCGSPNSRLQYMQVRSLAITVRASSRGIFHRDAVRRSSGVMVAKDWSVLGFGIEIVRADADSKYDA